MEYEVTVNRRVYRITREQVVDAVRGVKPGRVQSHEVQIGRTWYPSKQVFAIVFGLERADFNTDTARRAFRRMGFPVRVRGKVVSGEAAEARPPLKPDPDLIDLTPEEDQYINVPPILLEWFWWEWWDDLAEDARGGGGVGVPPEPGVYEVRIYDEQERLHIGRASNLRARVKHALVTDSSPDTTGGKIRRNEDTSRVCVRWATTDRPAAVEEELHRQHVERFGRLPKYTQHT
jgi:hypothetical protein